MKPIVSLLVLLAAWPGTVRAADLVRGSAPRCLVVTADSPSPAAKAGAKLLSGQLTRVFGAPVAATTESGLADVTLTDGRLAATHRGAKPETFLLVGESPLAARLGVTAAGLGPGAIRLRTVGNTLVLLGAAAAPSDPDGSRHAAVTFLEDVVGMRYLWPGELGLVTPRHETLALPHLDRKFTPAIAQRKIRWASRNDRMDAGLAYLGFTPEDYDTRFAKATGRTDGLRSV